MRKQLLKLLRGNSTKAERRFAELLKELHIPFQAKVKIGGREVDFLIGRYAIEIDGEDAQDVEKNQMLISLGFNPIHLGNWHVSPLLKEWLLLINPKKTDGN